jgi:ribosome-associated protein
VRWQTPIWKWMGKRSKELYQKHGGIGKMESFMENQTWIHMILDALEDKKGRDIVTLDMKELTILTDGFVICTGTSSTHVKALRDEVERRLLEIGKKPLHVSGYRTAKWILMDYGSVFVHILDAESRAFYDIERLWSDGLIKAIRNEEKSVL